MAAAKGNAALGINGLTSIKISVEPFLYALLKTLD